MPEHPVMEWIDAPVGKMGIAATVTSAITKRAPWFGGARRTPGSVSGDRTHPETELILHCNHSHVAKVVHEGILVKNSFNTLLDNATVRRADKNLSSKGTSSKHAIQGRVAGKSLSSSAEGHDRPQGSTCASHHFWPAGLWPLCISCDRR